MQKNKVILVKPRNSTHIKHRAHLSTFTKYQRTPKLTTTTPTTRSNNHRPIISMKMAPLSNKPSLPPLPDLPVSESIEKLRELAPQRSPLERMGIHIPQSLKQQHFGDKFDDMEKLQKGNYSMANPFHEDIISSSQKVQQGFHGKQHHDVFEHEQRITQKLTTQAANTLPSTPATSKSISAKQQREKMKVQNVGVVGTLEDATEEQTFSRTLFYGFAANSMVMNGMAFQGSIIASPSMVYLWKPTRWEEVTAESLAFLQFLWPTPDVILFGCGSTAKAIDPSAHHFLRTMNLPYELLSSHACMGTFNLLNEEYRRVVAFCVGFDHQQQYDKELIKHIQKTEYALTDDNQSPEMRKKIQFQELQGHFTQ